MPRFVTLFTILSALAAIASADADLSPYEKRTEALEPRQRRCLNPGWVPICPGALPCVPPGGICCSGNTYVMPPNTCRDGSVPVATAPAASATITAAPTISATPIPPAVIYSTYRFTITITYWFYYYTYLAVVQSTAYTSSRTTYLTEYAVTATDAAQATAIYNSVSATLSFPTPSQTGTPIVGATSYGSSTPTPVSSSPVGTGTGVVPPSSTSSGLATYTGAAASLKSSFSVSITNAFLYTIGAVMVVPGLLMVVL